MYWEFRFTFIVSKDNRNVLEALKRRLGNIGRIYPSNK